MFCPKCGAKLPDNAAFCGSCGAQLAARQQQVKQAAAVSSAARPSGGATPAVPVASGVSVAGMSLAPIDLVGRILAVISAIMLFMPIISIPAMKSLQAQYNQYLSQYASSLSGYGIPTGDLEMLMSGNYSAFDLNTMMGYAAKAGGSSAGFAALLGIMIVAAMLIMLALIIGGFIMSFVGQKSTKLLRVGCIVTAAMAVSLAIGTIVVNITLQAEISRTFSGYGVGMITLEVPITLWIMIICALVSYVLVDKATKDRLAPGEVEHPDPLAVGAIGSCLTGFVGIAIGIVAIVRNKDSQNRRLAIIGLVATCAIMLIVFILGNVH